MSLTTEQEEKRARGIGGSEAAAIMGLSPWKSPYQVWQDKRGLSGTREETPSMKWGLILEPVIRQQYAEETGQVVRLPGHLVDADHPFMLATVDGVTDDRVLEIKTSRSSQDWGEPGTDEIPMVYLFQVQQYMRVTRLPLADVAVLIGGSDFRIYTVEEDKELQSMIIEREAAFWERVEKDIPPEPISYADAVKRFRLASARTVTASESAWEAVNMLKVIKNDLTQLAATEEAARLIIMKELQDADTLIAPDGSTLATWKQAKDSERFDTKAFQAAQPDLYKQFLKTTPGSRRFLVK